MLVIIILASAYPLAAVFLFQYLEQRDKAERAERAELLTRIRAERSELLTRIQAPEAVALEALQIPPQGQSSLPFDDDAAWREYADGR